nr:Ig-like domain protein [Oriental turtle dovepox virus]
MDVVKGISILIVLFYTSESYDVYVDNGDTLPLTCILPAIKHANKVVLLEGNKKIILSD